MRCGIIIVNYNTADLVADCLHSLCQAIALNQDHVVIVDNNSQDNSCKKLALLIQENSWNWVSLLPMARNDGFAAGNNAGIRFLLQNNVSPVTILLLNPDTVVKQNAVRYMYDFLMQHPNVGVVGAQLFNAEGQPESSARRFPSVLSELETGAKLGVLSRILWKWQVPLPVSQEAHPCDWVSGAAMMLRREAMEQAGLMDEGYFLYFEEVDYCRRVRNLGWEIWLESKSQITHLEGASTGIQSVQKRRATYWYDSRRRYFIKHLGVTQWLLADFLWALGRSSLLARKALGFGRNINSGPHRFMRDLVWGDLTALASGNIYTIKRTPQ